MKSTYNIGRTVIGDENEITKDEVRVVKFPDGTIELSKRDNNGKFQSLTSAGSKIANIDETIYGVDNPGKILSLIEKHFNIATEFDKLTEPLASEYKFSLMSYKDEINTIRELLPERLESANKHTNIAGYVGCKLDNGGYALTSLEHYLKVDVHEDDGYVVFGKFESDEEL